MLHYLTARKLDFEGNWGRVEGEKKHRKWGGMSGQVKTRKAETIIKRQRDEEE